MSRDRDAVAYCPHCQVALPSGPGVAMRCEACQLFVAPGRSLDAPRSGRVGGVGGASGRIANAAAREGLDAIDPLIVIEALQAMADRLGVPVERLRLFDYETTRDRAGGQPSVGMVIATFGTWKAARAAARDHRVASDAAVRDARRP